MMKKVLLTAVIAVMIVSSAGAAELYLAWAPGSNVNGQEIYLSPGQSAILEVYISSPNAELMAGVGFQFVSEPGIFHAATHAALPGWVAGPGYGLFAGAPGQQFNVNLDGAAVPLTPEGVLFGTMEIRRDCNVIGDPIELMIDLTANVGLVQSSGSLMMLMPAYSSIAGFYKVGAGAGAKPPFIAANPMIVRAPEPASLALLALGGLALIRRR